MIVNVLKHWHPMIGVDAQLALMPPLATPTPKTPHFVCAMLKIGPWGALTGKSRTDVRTSSYGETMIRGTDIGPLIPHISTPHYLLPVHILISASKSEFGASSVRTADGPVAVACLGGVNLNLNCWGPTYPPLPFGVVMAFTTHVTGFTLGDILAGCIMMVLDAAIQFALNKIFAGKTPVGRILDRAFNRVATAALSSILGKMNPMLVRAMVNDALIDRSGEMIWHYLNTRGRSLLLSGLSQAAVDSLLPTVVSQILGSPMGFAYSGGVLGQADRAGGPSDDTSRSFTDSVHDGFANVFEGREWDEYP